MVAQTRGFRQPVVGQNESAFLVLRKVVEENHGYFSHSELAGGKLPAVTGDDAASCVDENRHYKAEFTDARCELRDLRLRVCSRITRVRGEPINRPLVVEKGHRTWHPANLRKIAA